MELKSLKGMGPARIKALSDQQIYTVADLLMELPVDYLDLTMVRDLLSLRPGETACLQVEIDGAVTAQRIKGLHITKTRVCDDSGSMPVVWYNQPWLKQQLHEGKPLLLFGKCEVKRNVKQLVSPTIQSERGLISIYRALPGLPPKTLRKFIEMALDDGAISLFEPDALPESLRARHGLMTRAAAIAISHRPADGASLKSARGRLAFEELLLYQVALRLQRGTGRRGVQIQCGQREADAFWAAMPFAPTNAQRRVQLEIFNDMGAPNAMARLVQGDVGSGKTALAFGALYATVKSGKMGALMAPTEILAQQHYETAKALLEPLGIRCGLLTGSMTQKAKKIAHQAMAAGEWDVAIGTHALISEGVEYKNLGLVITDEQHRFGVRQRTTLSDKAYGDAPNVLVMSATPIPRTLALILYGDLDVSIVDELPPGRTPIKTRIVPEDKRKGMYQFLIDEVARGHQAYIVCPLVEESEAVDAKPAEVLYEELRKGALKSLRVGLAHGRMKPQDKEEILSQFHAGKIDVLISTTVIEVGVNVPNASVMIIENAERFGLAQLHQLRGRVGRGAAESWCFLMAEANERLNLLVQTTDGFVIAQKDMDYRGPGELLGYRQSGSLGGMSALMGDVFLLQQTHDEAKRLMENPKSQETELVIKLAQQWFDDKMSDVGIN